MDKNFESRQSLTVSNVHEPVARLVPSSGSNQSPFPVECEMGWTGKS